MESLRGWKENLFFSWVDILCVYRNIFDHRKAEKKIYVMPDTIYCYRREIFLLFHLSNFFPKVSLPKFLLKRKKFLPLFCPPSYHLRRKCFLPAQKSPAAPFGLCMLVSRKKIFQTSWRAENWKGGILELYQICSFLLNLN